jgi:hypothetical protein
LSLFPCRFYRPSQNITVMGRPSLRAHHEHSSRHTTSLHITINQAFTLSRHIQW